MNRKGIYADKPALFQVALLLCCILAGGLLSSVVGAGILRLFPGDSSNLTEHPDGLRLLQFVSSIGMFLFPALAVAWTCSKRPEVYLSTHKMPGGRLFFLLFVSMFLLSPTISLTGVLNKQLELPASLAPIDSWMRAQELLAERMTEALLSGNDGYTLLLNLLVIAVTAAVTEEFLFRGVLQRIIAKWTPNHHLVIWGTAILFSAFHVQFFGFIPRLLLGAYFGYLLFWSKSIWLPVFAHFVNNATAVIGLSNSQWKEYEFISGEIADEQLAPFACVSLITLIGFALLVRQIRRETSVS